MARINLCPLCGSPLTKAKFDRVTRIDAARAKELHQAHQRQVDLQKALKQAKSDKKRERKVGEQKGREFEKKRSERLVRGLEKKLVLANDRIRQLQKGTTPQTEGLEFEDQLVTRLRREFPDDQVVHEGKGGDVLHTVFVKRKPAGLILYECKRYKTINRAHVDQAARDKRARHADFAILVTTGTRPGFNGLARDGSVLIVAPLAVLALVGVVRIQIIELARARLSHGERERVALAALDYLTSPAFSGPLEEAVGKARRAQQLLRKEYDDHVRVWRERWGLYQTIDLNLTNIASNVGRVREGSKPVPLDRARPPALQLPAVAGEGPLAR
jgi:hypothetical protein